MEAMILMSTLNLQLIYRRSKRRPLIIRTGLLTLHYPCLVQISMVQKMFEPFKFDLYQTWIYTRQKGKAPQHTIMLTF